ncbi:hypothetical protein H0H81_011636 [Sphagnurus paluster]|uniref:Uncharacterized protein n=1 Tax=Sphagnurus paluster TaxID=117069 RepID=A0A9P7FNM5_9AGAR|nr:hypothetical protein H0H81_011636 [Sphagnurus paluster]
MILGRESKRRNRSLREILSKRPCLGSFVRNLELAIVETQEAHRFSNLLSHLTRLRALTLVEMGGLGNKWKSFSTTFRVALLQLIWLPTLYLFEINFEDFPFPYLRFCSNLKNLILLHRLYCNALDVDNTPEPELVPLLSLPSVPVAGPGHLEALAMGNWIALRKLLAVVQHPSSILSVVRLELFKALIVQKEDLNEVSKVLSLAAPTIRILGFVVSISPEDSDPVLPLLEKLTHLERLQFTTDGFSAKRASDWACKALEAIPVYNRLDTVIFEVKPMRNPGDMDWRRIDRILTRERHEKMLTRVLLIVPRPLEDDVAQMMPLLDERVKTFFLR